MKRILLVSCEGLGNGGVQAVIMSIVRNLVPIRISHTHIVSRKSNILADMIEKNRKKTIENCETVKIGCSVEVSDGTLWEVQTAL